MTDDDREELRGRETLVPCPKCAAKGYLMVPIPAPSIPPLYTGPTEPSVEFRREDCDLCAAKGAVTVEQRRAWKSGHPGSLR